MRKAPAAAGAFRFTLAFYTSRMTSMLLLVAIAVVAGVAVALQGQFMGVMDRSLGTRPSVLITYGIGAVGAVALWLVRPRSIGVRDVPWYGWTSGLLGLVIVGGIGYAAPRLGLSRTIILSVASQLLAAAVIDHFGLFGATQRSFDLARATGFALTFSGVWLIVRGA